MEIDRGAICCLELAAALAAADAVVAAVDAEIDGIAQLSISLRAARSTVRIRDALRSNAERVTGGAAKLGVGGASVVPGACT